MTRIYYSEYGASGDGVTDDFDAIIRAHAAANESGAEVFADDGAVYYIGASDRTALIQTDTDWGGAKFIIDDTQGGQRKHDLFSVCSKLAPVRLPAAGAAMRKNQEQTGLPIERRSLVAIRDDTTARYIREGLNQDSGQAQTDVFIADKNGNIDMAAPVIWDFGNITSAVAYPIDEQTLTVKGGHFTTVANRAESKYTYYKGGINVARSNTIIDGVTHEVTGEGDHGAPYAGFITVHRCADVLVQNCALSGHKIYTTIGSAGKPVPMGSYDISAGNSVNVTFKDCTQLNDIHDAGIWGIFGSNYCKNLTFDTVRFSRFDAHCGVRGAVIKNSVLGYMGVHLIGHGTFLLENTSVYARSLINLRSDYGSTWDGDIIIKNCEFIPRSAGAALISGSYSGQHDFGYTCYMPRKITIDGLKIDDGRNPDAGPRIFGDFNRDYTSAEYVQKYPYVITEEVEISNLKIKSGRSLSVSENPFMFRNVKIINK